MRRNPFRLLLLLTSIAVISGTFAQVSNDEVLMTIAGKKVTVDEFISIYQKNNVKNQPIDQEALAEYLDLFINFKLKVREAEDLGLDTVTSFKTELAGYREQLAKPYFMDEATMENLVQEAFTRSEQDIRASHIFVRVAPDASPEDTLAAWKKITGIRQRLANGEKFDELAIEYSEDPSARDREPNAQHPFIKGNKGDLGYFTVFDMVYPFESAAYTTPENEVSKPIRSEYGYHLIKVTKKQPAMGKVTVAHLYKAIPKDATAEDSLKIRLRIDSIYTMLQNGGKWDSLVKIYSDDKGSAARGGTLPKFGVNRMVPEFIEAIYQLKKEGDYSKPILTSYGWHIIRLEERDRVPPFSEMKGELKQKVIKDSRAMLAREVVTTRIINEFGLKEYPAAKEEFYAAVTDSIFLGKWNVSLADGLNKPLFKIGDQVTNQSDFATYLASKQKKGDKQTIRLYVNKQYNDFLQEKLLQVENQNLENKYPEFKALMHEYRDGILLFDLTDKKVWSKAVKDTTGLKDFYEKNKSTYMWPPRVDASIYTVKNPEVAVAVRNFLSTGLSDDAILKEINKDTLQLLTIHSGKFSQNDHPVLALIKWEKGLSENIPTEEEIVFVNIREALPSQQKELNEARGLITADYQNFLEAQWINDLKKKYPVEVHQEVLAKIK
ncbi:MAG: peptidyl-prolyl cis-trans isomerase [Bacteroidetes bacterium]|nr:MAG: peptidyl-prolyl cis-trans isomerase [Bacteroidota bacterium]